MNCNEANRLVNAHADGELDLATSLAVEEHLESCPACRRSCDRLQAVRAAVARHAAAPPAPESLRGSLGPDAQASPAGRLLAWFRTPLAAAVPGVVALALAGWLAFSLPERVAPSTPALRIVYHISSSDNASAALRNLSNHLRAAPHAKVVVVAHNEGVDFLLAGARDGAGQPFEDAVREFRKRGVEFRLCMNTLERRGITRAKVIPEVVVVPSGIAEIGRLQIEEGYAYMRL
jgi:hypothetical protein